jgi:SET domain-containing protein
MSNKSYGFSSKLTVNDINSYGKGVFAVKKIKKDEVLCVFFGNLLPVKEEEKLPEGFNDVGFQVTEDLLIGVSNESKLELDNGAYFNHSCEPNAGFRGQIILVAMRDIRKGEQVVFDYAMVLSKSKGAKKYELKCLCGSEKCRGYITDDDWKIPSLQKKYKGYFQWYLQEKIKKQLKKK